MRLLTNTRVQLFPLILAMLLVGGCAITHSTNLMVGNARTPTNPEQVKIYTNPPAKYEEIAIVSADAAHDFMRKQELMDIAVANLKKEAAKVGANGIILRNAGAFNVGSSGVAVIPSTGNVVIGTAAMNARTGEEVSGMAIFVIKE